MITAGIDVGVENTRIVILKDGDVIGRGAGRSGGAGRGSAVEGIWWETLKEAKLEASDVANIVATGKGKHEALIANDRYTEPVTAVKAARFLCPDADVVVDAGADETLIAAINKKGLITETTVNQKCGAGLGTFLKYMAYRLEMTPEEMGALPPREPGQVTVSDGCVVFAELDALSLLNNGVPPKEVAAAVTEAAAVRASAVIMEPTLPMGDKILLVGGLSRNTAFVAALEKYAGVRFIIPEDAEYAGALGAALAALPEPVI